MTAHLIVYTVRCGVTFDPEKDAENVRKHGVSLERANDFDVLTALLIPDVALYYGEERWTAVGWLDAMMYTLILVFLPTSGRAISLRKSTREEKRLYADNA